MLDLNTRLTLSVIAALFCLSLGFFSLWQKGGTKLNYLFAAYNFANAFWNIGELTVLLSNSLLRETLLRFTGIGGALFLPPILHFTYDLIGISSSRKGRFIIRIFYIMGISFAFLHQTPWLNINVTTFYGHADRAFSVPGPTYPLFALYLLSGLSALAFPLPGAFKKAHGEKRNQIGYILLALGVGIIAIASFFVSLFSKSYPWDHYILQCLIGLIFATAIFKHHLLPIKIVIRRAVLLTGVYAVLGSIMLPLSFFYFKKFIDITQPSYFYFAVFSLIFGSALSIGIFIYMSMIKRISIFHEKEASHLAHEFKSPLYSIQSAKAILEDELDAPNPNPQKINRYLEMIQRNVDRLENFVTDILALSKGMEGDAKNICSEFNIVDIVQDISGVFPKEKTRFKIESKGSALYNGHKEGVRQILLNLISNAVKFSKNKLIHIQIIGKDTFIQVRVADQGRGLKKEDLVKIFEPFVRVGTETARSKGSGLGLTIARKWVEFHNGRIWAESEGLGHGTTIVFRLPRD